MLTNRSHSPLYLPLLIAVCGILFSVWNALDAASVPCVSAGCTLYQNFSINGYSLWWGGVGIFSLLGLLALTGRAVLGRWLAGLAVLLDCVLLGIMILTLPCVACMVTALLLALSYITFRAATLADTHRSALHHASPLLVFWAFASYAAHSPAARRNRPVIRCLFMSMLFYCLFPLFILSLCSPSSRIRCSAISQ